MKKIFSAVICLILVFSLAGCAFKKENKETSGTEAVIGFNSGRPTISLAAGVFAEEQDSPFQGADPQQDDVMQDEKYDAVFVNTSIEDFLNAGFAFGDSCDVVFSNGLTFTDIPFYNGYYVRTKQPLVVGYPGYQYLAITCNNAGLWTEAGLKEGDSVTISLNTEGKYLAVQEALSQSYSNDRAKYTDDVQFANFRALKGGDLKEDFLFRGASPCNNEKNRAPYANALIEEKKVAFILDLADSETDFAGYRAKDDFVSNYTASLCDAGSVALLSMSSNYGSDAYKQKLASGLRKMIAAEGPVYVHCTEGKDRTGFVCMLLEALAGADYDEMLADYMKTYDNYYGVTKEATPEKYAAITDLYFDAFAACLHGTEDIEVLKKADYTADAANYLLSAGMTSDEIEALKKMITK